MSGARFFEFGSPNEISTSRPGRQFIVIFANSETSLELAEKIHEIYPTQVVAIFLHQVVDKKALVIATPFYTSFDIAMNENKSGRMSRRRGH
jgi:hypothetical protein